MTCLISYVNWVDRPDAGIATSPGPSTLPAANLADPVVQGVLHHPVPVRQA
jgi:hypothetical protein